ncbi:MAG: hypothetical protein V3R78_10065 [Thermodesulfobacteriota bacterium]
MNFKIVKTDRIDRYINSKLGQVLTMHGSEKAREAAYKQARLREENSIRVYRSKSPR